MSDSEWEELVAAFRKDEVAMEYWAELRELPEAPAAWLDKVEVWMTGALRRVPDSIASEFRPLIANQIRLCRRALHRRDEQHTRMLFAVLEENIGRLNYNTAAHHVNTSRQERQKGGKEAGDLKRQQAHERMEQARKHWGRLNQPEREKAGIVAKIMGVDPRTVRRWKNQGWKLEDK